MQTVAALMQWFDGGESVLTALGAQYNYTVQCEYSRYRLWKVSQSWYRDDLDSTILLKTTWRNSCEEAQAQAEAWEGIYGTISTLDRSRSGRIRAAARSTRGNRQRVARSFAPQQKRSYR